MHLPRILGTRVRDHLDLLELVHAEHAACVAPGRAGLAPEARRERAVIERQRLEDLVHVHRDQRHLGRADEVEVVGGDLVVVALFRREEAGAVHRVLAHEHRGEDGREAFADEPVEREPIESERHERRVAEDEAEARAGHLCAAFEVEVADFGVLLRVGQLRWLAPPFDLDRLVLRQAVGRRLVRRIRNLAERGVPLGLCRRELRLERGQLLLARLQLLELLGRRLALELLLAAQLFHLRQELPPVRVRGDQVVERIGRAATRERRAHAFRVVACCADVDHRAKNASSTCATPSSSADGQVRSARAFTTG